MEELQEERMKAQRMEGEEPAIKAAEASEHWSPMKRGTHGWMMKQVDITKSKNWGYKIPVMGHMEVEDMEPAALVA